MTISFFGLKSCDTCRKARKELDAASITYSYTDVRGDGITASDISRWIDTLNTEEEGDWVKLINKSSTTWRGLSEKEKNGLDVKSAKKLLVDHPTLAKRPIIETDAGIYVGWKADVKNALIG
ncbi:MAG: Spx/MgsR family RNA polymerase-binding regulatory protein [Pseudomonadota bacterium]